MKPTGVQRWGPRRQWDHVLQLSDKSPGDERGRRVFTTCTTGRQSSKAVVPTATFQERVGVQLRMLGDQITQVKPGVGSHATHARADQAAGPRGCGRDDRGGEQGSRVRRAGNPAGCGRDREKHNVTEAMVQIRERSRARGVVSRAPSRRSSKRSSVGKVLVCKNGEQREILKSVQVENAVEVIRVERTYSDIASLTQQSAQSDSSLTTVSAAKEKETQDSSQSEAKYLNDTLKRANLTRAELMDDVDTSQRVISVL